MIGPCFTCGEAGHLARNCKRPVQGARPGVQERQNAVAQQGVNVISSITENSMMLAVELDRQGVSCLIDTGAAVSILPSNLVGGRVVTRFSEKQKPGLKTVTGQALDVVGEVVLEVKLGHCVTMHKFVVVEFHTCPILGSDFLVTHGMVLDLGNKQVHWIGGVAELATPVHSDAGRCRVVWAEDIEASNQKLIVRAKVEPENSASGMVRGTCLLEPHKSFVQKTGVCVARALVEEGVQREKDEISKQLKELETRVARAEGEEKKSRESLKAVNADKEMLERSLAARTGEVKRLELELVQSKATAEQQGKKQSDIASENSSLEVELTKQSDTVKIMEAELAKVESVVSEQETEIEKLQSEGQTVADKDDVEHHLKQMKERAVSSEEETEKIKETLRITEQRMREELVAAKEEQRVAAESMRKRADTEMKDLKSKVSCLALSVRDVSKELESVKLATTKEVVVDEEIALSQRHQSEQYDKAHRVGNSRSYQVGQWVLLTEPASKKGTSPKLSPKYSGPYLIVDVPEGCPNVVIRRAQSSRAVQKRVHVNRLKPFYRQSFEQGEVVTERADDGLQVMEEYFPYTTKGKKKERKASVEQREIHAEQESALQEEECMQEDEYLPGGVEEQQIDNLGGPERPTRNLRLPQRLQDYELF